MHYKDVLTELARRLEDLPEENDDEIDEGQSDEDDVQDSKLETKV